MSTLYRKYRPQKFIDLIGQEHLVQTLTNEISTGKIAHAYLFSGPRGIGKTTMARLFAKAINCENRKENEFEPCDDCPSCREISAARNIDVIEIDAASHTQVENVRENIIENSQFKPTKSKHKVFIIDEVHMLSNSSFNALLKTLEEPPSYVVFILATTELHKLPATIISRCQRFNFKKLPEDLIVKKLDEIADSEKIKVDKDVLKRIAVKSDGAMRDAESLLGQVMSLNLKKIGPEDAALILPVADIESALGYIEAIIEKKPDAAISTLDNIVKKGASVDQFALDVIDTLRAAMIAQTGSASYGLDYSEKDRKKISAFSKKISVKRLVSVIDSAIKRRSEIKQAPVPQLPYEMLAVEFSNESKNDDNISEYPPTIANKPVGEANHNQPTPKSDAKTEPPAQERKNVTDEPVVSLNIEQAQIFWKEMIEKLSVEYPSLAFVLKMGEVNEICGNKIYVSFPYSFHKEKVEEKKTKKMIDECLSELFNGRVSIECKVQNTEEKKADSDITNLAAEFGGEVIV